LFLGGGEFALAASKRQILDLAHTRVFDLTSFTVCKTRIFTARG